MCSQNEIYFQHVINPRQRCVTSSVALKPKFSRLHARRSSVDLNDACINKQPHYLPSAMICCAATALCCAFAACCRARSAFTAPCARLTVACNAATRCCSGVLGFTGFISERRIGYLAKLQPYEQTAVRNLQLLLSEIKIANHLIAERWYPSAFLLRKREREPFFRGNTSAAFNLNLSAYREN